jgi:HSP20 family protein
MMPSNWRNAMGIFWHRSKTAKVPAEAPTPVVPSNEVESTATAFDVGALTTVEPRAPAAVGTLDAVERFNTLFDQWLGWPPEMVAPTWLPDGMIRVDESTENGTRVIRAELPGIDLDKDVELFVSDGMLCIDARRREEQRSNDAGYVRHAVRYGAFTRVIPLGGANAADINASYKDGVLEVRIPASGVPQTKAIPISTT